MKNSNNNFGKFVEFVSTSIGNERDKFLKKKKKNESIICSVIRCLFFLWIKMYVKSSIYGVNIWDSVKKSKDELWIIILIFCCMKDFNFNSFLIYLCSFTGIEIFGLFLFQVWLSLQRDQVENKHVSYTWQFWYNFFNENIIIFNMNNWRIQMEKKRNI